MECLPQIVKEEIRLLVQDDIDLTPEEIVWLYELGKVVENPELTMRAKAGIPVRCGPLVLWPPTIQADLWFEGYASKLFAEPDMITYCLCFAMRYGREERLPEWSGATCFAELNTFESIQKAVMAWAMRIPARVDELEAALNQMLDGPNPPHKIKRKGKPDDPQEWDVLAECMAATGMPAEYWQRQTFARAGAVLRAKMRQDAIILGGGPQKNEVDDKAATALAEFGAAVDAIRKSRKEQANGE